MMGVMLRFAVSGGLATGTHALVFVTLIEWLAVRPLFAAGVAFVLALFVSYGMNYHWTFSVSGPHRIMLPRFFLVAVSGLLLNLGITYAVVDVAGYWYGYALLLVVLLVPLMTFVLSRLWVFSTKE